MLRADSRPDVRARQGRRVPRLPRSGRRPPCSFRPSSSWAATCATSSRRSWPRRMTRCIEDVVRSGEPSTLEYDLPLRGRDHATGRRASCRCDTDKVLSIVRDVTDRKRAEDETRELRDELAHVGRVTSLGALTGSLAHEINQPLASIMANAQAALRMLAAPRSIWPSCARRSPTSSTDDRRAGEVLRRLRALLTKEAPESEPLDMKSTLEEILELVHSDVRDAADHARGPARAGPPAGAGRPRPAPAGRPEPPDQRLRGGRRTSTRTAAACPARPASRTATS